MNTLAKMIEDAKAQSAASWAVAIEGVKKERAQGIYRHPQTMQEAQIEARRIGMTAVQSMIDPSHFYFQ